MAGFGDVLRGLGSVLNPQVMQGMQQEDQQRIAQQGQMQGLLMSNLLSQNTPQAQIQMQAMKNDQAFRQGATQLDPNDPQYASKMAQLATQYGKPEIAATLFKTQEDRKARLQTASENIATRRLQLEQLHEQALQRMTDSSQRQQEISRHNQEMEQIGKVGNSIKQQLANFNAPNMGEGNTTIENTAKMVAEGRLAPLSGFVMKTPFGQQVMSRVLEINPDYRGQDFAVSQAAEKGFTAGKQGNIVRSFNVALSHLDTLGNLADAMNNGQLPMVNKIANQFATSTGQPAPNTFESAKQIVGDEIVKAIVGAGGGVADREHAQQTVSAANSPAQLKSVIANYKELMNGQLGGLKRQYEASVGKKDFEQRFLSPEARSVVHGGNTSSSKVVDFGSLK